MEIILEEQESKGRAFIGELAEMTYSKAGQDTLIIDHTRVDDALRGQGAGKKMLSHLIEKARTQNLKIIPLCPFVKSVFDKNPDLHDVLK